MCLLILRGPAGDVELKPPTPLEVVRAQEQGPRALRAQGWEDPIIVGSWEVPQYRHMQANTQNRSVFTVTTQRECTLNHSLHPHKWIESPYCLGLSVLL